MLLHPLKNNRGLALIFMVLLFTAAATAVVSFIALGVKIKGIHKEGTTQQRLVEIRTALQNYYLIRYDLPDPSLTTPPNSVPTDLLNLPQRYRFDSNGQLIHYDRLPANGHMVTVRNVLVHGGASGKTQVSVAAVLVAAGSDKSIDPSNRISPYGTSVTDDLVLEVSLEAESLKVANHTVSILQQTAKAYDSIFNGKNDDLDTWYYPPRTIWVDLTAPTRVQVWEAYEFDPVTNDPTRWHWVDDPQLPLQWHNNYSGDDFTTYVVNDDTDPNGGGTTTAPISLGDEYVAPDPWGLPRPIARVDEDGYAPAQGGVDGNTPSGSSCVRISNVGLGVVLSNDPNRGVATLDHCRDQVTGVRREPAFGLAVAYGLNLIKLGYDPTTGSLLDPWGNKYLWGGGDSTSIYGNLGSSRDPNRNPHYWTFFSAGPDGQRDTNDDILPPSDRIRGY